MHDTSARQAGKERCNGKKVGHVVDLDHLESSLQMDPGDGDRGEYRERRILEDVAERVAPVPPDRLAMDDDAS